MSRLVWLGLLSTALVLALACASTATLEPTGTPTPTRPLEPSPTASPTSATQATPPPTSLSLRPMRVRRAFPNLNFKRLTNLVQASEEDGRLFVTEQEGRIQVFANDQRASDSMVFLDIRDRVRNRDNEEGLLGIAFAPDFNENGFFYVYYSASRPTRSVLSRFSTSRGDHRVSDPKSELVIMEILQPFSNHNGGQIAFGPDTYLYVGLGDGGSGGDPLGNGQDPGTLLGSILRIDVRNPPDGKNYGIPPDNPFVGVSGAREEVWAYGLRNPWRFSFDEATGLLWVGDVGQARWEEIDVVEKGMNYGWNLMEGFHCFSPREGCDRAGLQLPVAEYGHADGCSVTGGYVYRGGRLPSLLGAYVYADFCSGKIWGLRHDGQAVTEHRLLVDSDLPISSFGVDLAGNLYVLSLEGGIYVLEPA